MNGFLINVYDKGMIYKNNTYTISPVIYRGHLHIDPVVTPPYCYGDHPENKVGLKSFQLGDALIFHSTLIDEKRSPYRYIIGGMKIGSIKKVRDLNKREKKKYQENPHVFHKDEMATLYYDIEPLFQDEITYYENPNPYLKIALPFTAQIANDIGLKIHWKKQFKPYQQIAWSTRAVRKIEEDKVNLIIENARRIYEERS